ncbi:MAG: NTP transferase domain-containing protein, partial [Chloroflexi bacterium]|nr:NTP transferase domain-containing protein [Chloroflexota bacterium]
MKVIIPLAGFGTRLRPHTYSRPKPLVDVAGKPVLGHILDKLEGLDVEEVCFIVGYLGEQIEAYVSKNYHFPARYLEQKELLGQAHAVGLAQPYVDGAALILFVDTIFEANLLPLADITTDGVIFVREVEDPRRFGIVTLKDDLITRFVEKPSEPISHLAVIGLYYLKHAPDLFAAIEELMQRRIQTKGEYFLADALQLMVERGARLNAWPVDVWEDCGTPEAVLQTNRYLLGKLAAGPASPGVIPPVYIGTAAQVENSVVGPYVHLGDGCRVVDSRLGPYVSLAAGA